MSGPDLRLLLTEADLRLVSSVSGGRVGAGSGADAADLDAQLRSPALYATLFASGGSDPLIRASPYLVFSVLVNRVAADLVQAAFVEEWFGPRRTVPVFDVGSLREFLEAAWSRGFLAELLASYTHVASGSVWQRTPRGWRRRRYSELNPMRLAELLEVVPASQWPAVCRRLGDLALFTSGVFPEHAADHPLEARQVERISRLLDATRLAAPSGPPGEVVRAVSPQRGIWLLEWLGRRAYSLASVAAGASGSELSGVVDGFGRARRILNLLTRRYLYPSRDRWFSSAL
jgi:hypothetical protein